VTLVRRLVFSFNLSFTKIAFKLLILTLILTVCKKLLKIHSRLVIALSALDLRLIANTLMLRNDVIANLTLAKRAVYHNCI